MSYTVPGLSADLASACSFAEPTPIQLEAIPAILKGRDVLGTAKTGSGKTLSYVLPILQRLTGAIVRQRKPSVLILVPTRELANQVREVIQSLLPALPERRSCYAVFGGVSVNAQMQGIGRTDILIATPGRLLDLIEKNALSLSEAKTLVLDEADKILNLGFKPQLAEIFRLLPDSRQSLLFSATAPGDLAAQLHDPAVIKIESDDDEILINQTAYSVTDIRRGPLLRYLIKSDNLQQVLVFVSSTLSADRVLNKLTKNGITATVIHSKLSQGGRRDALDQFKSGKVRVLVATDLLSRGVDIDQLPTVINYELPRSPKDYIHRIGRTGRAGSPGEAISLVSPEEEHHFKVIQKKTRQRVGLTPSEEINLHGF